MRRTIRVLLAACLGVGAIGVGSKAMADDTAGQRGQGKCDGSRERTQQIVRDLFRRREVADVDGLWQMFANGGMITFPFTGDKLLPPTVYVKPQDEAVFKAGIGALLSSLVGLTFTDLVFTPLAERGATLVSYHGHATVSFTGKEYDARLLTEVHVACGRVTAYTEWYDPAVLLEALTP